MRVVLVAINRTLMESLAAILATRAHDVLRFTEAEAALRHIEEDETVNAVIVVSPQDPATGAEICWNARLMAGSERPLYICQISKPLNSAQFIEALDCGADDVLQLPLSSDELYARLRAAERLNQIQLQLIEMATRDGLTGLLNRPAFFSRATRRCALSAAPPTAIMVDIDHFKSINDTYGHAAGDRALRAIAAILQCDGVLAGRLGGEEFALLFEHGDMDAALECAETLRRRIALETIAFDGVNLRLTCSFGVAIGEPGENIDQILRKADSALYRAKRSGRDRVRLFDPLATSGDPTRAGLSRGANRIATPVGGLTGPSVITA